MKDIRKARVYQIINRITGESYIGSTKNQIASRWNYHIQRLKNGIHEIREWQDAWNKSEIKDWDFRILEDNIPVEEQFDKELTWQDDLKPSFGSKTYWHKKIHTQKVERVVEALNQGKNYRDIADEIGVSLGWVSLIKSRYICSIPFKIVLESKLSTKCGQKN